MAISKQTTITLRKKDIIELLENNGIIEKGQAASVRFSSDGSDMRGERWEGSVVVTVEEPVERITQGSGYNYR